MQRDEAVRILLRHRRELNDKFGVASLALFGSVIRNEASAESDVDVLVEFDDRPIGLFHLAALHSRLRELLGVEHVDVVMRDSLYPALRENILGEAVDVFAEEVGAAR